MYAFVRMCVCVCHEVLLKLACAPRDQLCEVWRRFALLYRLPIYTYSVCHRNEAELKDEWVTVGYLGLVKQLDFVFGSNLISIALAVVSVSVCTCLRQCLPRTISIWDLFVESLRV